MKAQPPRSAQRFPPFESWSNTFHHPRSPNPPLHSSDVGHRSDMDLAPLNGHPNSMSTKNQKVRHRISARYSHQMDPAAFLFQLNHRFELQSKYPAREEVCFRL